MGELLLELLSEEIPARMQHRAAADLAALLRDKLAAAEIPAAGLRFYVTPRRLVVIADGIAATQPDHTEERRGPRVGAPQAAIDGFLRSAGLGALADCEIRDTGRGQFYFAVIRRSGRPSAEVLPELIKAAITELPWPKSMRWPGAALRWVRPLTSMICLYEGEVVPLALGGVPVGRTTRGHRFLAPEEISVADAADYLEKLQQAYVVVDQDQRRELISADLNRCVAELGLAVKPDPGLLDEVTGLAEFPVVLAGRIDPDFVRPLPDGLPPEVLQTAMRTHQKYFSCVHSDGRPAPYFLFVAGNLAADDGKAIIAGNERVLRARLADARFFWDQDRKVRLEDRVEALKDRVYHAKLGNMRDRVDRIEKLSVFLKSFVPGDWPVSLARRAAVLAKADLSTGMVGEFPQLQGIIGRYYAFGDGEDPAIANAIAEHYSPLGSNDFCPRAPASITVALADKVIALVGFFAMKEKPTGSRDPFALRRAALGAIRLVLENNLRIPLRPVFEKAREIWDPMFPDVTSEVLDFFCERLKVHLREQGVRHDLIAAVFALGEDDLVRLLARVDALCKFLDSEDGGNLLIAYRRAANIVAIEEKRDGVRFDGTVDSTLFQQAEEVTLFHRLNGMGVIGEGRMASNRFDLAMHRLATLRQPVDEFFDKVTVNTDDPALRENRLRLLARIRDTMNQVADFSLIEG
ncbi:MAG: glycine--tRNA ligase subunit beta [Stellaceae bacterium]